MVHRHSGAGDPFRAHESVRTRGEIPVGVLPSVIEMSWQRCLDYGLDTDSSRDYDLLARERLADEIERNCRLLNHAQPVMDMLFEQIAGTQNVVVLANEEGFLLHRCGDPEFLDRADQVALGPGAEWSEACRGTNAVGTALAVEAPVIVHGDQHFLTANNFLTCSASPIFDPCGRLAGVLDVTGDHRGFSPHTLALVKMSVKMIENRLFAAAYANTLILRFHARQEFIGTLCEGMAAISEDGRLLSANGNACFQIGESLAALRGRSFDSVFGQPVLRVFDHLLARPQDPIALTLSNGVRVLARADFAALADRRARLMTGMAQGHAASARAAPARAALPCALSRLETGDPQIEAVVAKVRKVLGRDIPLLIQGETGTGKELLARAVHCAGPRADKPFVAVNCAAIPDGLIESELFGYEEGAFTGARRRGGVGRIQQADGGTLFLDEIGDMPLSLQARLLRVLQERVVTPLGGARSRAVDIAVICATHRRIRELVSAGSFREDLYYRLNGLTVMLPPLRAHKDLPVLIDRLLIELAGDSPPAIDADVLELFRRHPWPGNVRQLASLLRTAIVMAEGETSIRLAHLPDDFIEDCGLDPGGQAAAAPAGEEPATCRSGAAPAPHGDAQRLQDLALNAIREAVERHGGNISAAARQLGISRNTLYRKLHD